VSHSVRSFKTSQWVSQSGHSRQPVSESLSQVVQDN